MDYQLQPFDLLSLSDLYDVLALRARVFSLEQMCTDDDFDGFDKQAFHVTGKLDGEIVATARILPPGLYKAGAVSFGRIAIKKECRGKGYGRSIMKFILEYINQHYPNCPIAFSAQKYLQSFYESFGFVAYGDEYDEGGIPHVGMKGIGSAL